MFLSVIVPTRNRDFLLDRFLRSTTKQTINSSLYEILIIDNGSIDSTKDIVAKHSTCLPNLKYFYEPSSGLHSGRHRGFIEARGDILVYADDDIEAYPTWLEAIQKCFQNADVAMVGGKNLPNFESPPPDWIQSMWNLNIGKRQVLGYLSILDLGMDIKLISPLFVFGCNFSIRRQVLKEAGGFHPDGMPQNLIRYRGDGESHVSHYVASKRYKTLYHPEASVYHWVPNKRMTVEYFCHRAYKQGISDSYTQFRKADKSLNRVGISITTNQFLSLAYKVSSRSFDRIKKKIRAKIKSLFSQKEISGASVSSPKTEIEKIQAQIQSAYKAGYEFHQQAVNSDPVLLKWVMQPDYWDYRLPHLTNNAEHLKNTI